MKSFDSDGLWSGDRVYVQRQGNSDRFSVLVSRRMLVAEFPSKDWANAFAEVIDGFAVPGEGLDTTMRRVSEGLLSLASTKHLVAGVLRRAAELRQAASLGAIEDRERVTQQQVAYTLRTQADMLDGGRTT